MLLGLVALASMAALVCAQQTVPSVGGAIVYNCPTRSTIEAAYQDYCPAINTAVGAGDLTGTEQLVVYLPNYQTFPGSLQLTCQFGGDALCGYSAGGGQPISSTGSPEDACPRELSQDLPQPSPGVNYRRRREVSRRAIVGLVPAFTCPFTSNDPDYSVNAMNVRTGRVALDAASNLGITLYHGRVLYVCYINEFECYYVQDGTAKVYYAGGNGDTTYACPQSACAQVAPVGQERALQERRGIFLEGDQVRVKRNQMDPRLLRPRPT